MKKPCGFSPKAWCGWTSSIAHLGGNGCLVEGDLPGELMMFRALAAGHLLGGGGSEWRRLRVAVAPSGGSSEGGGSKWWRLPSSYEFSIGELPTGGELWSGDSRSDQHNRYTGIAEP